MNKSENQQNPTPQNPAGGRAESASSWMKFGVFALGTLIVGSVIPDSVRIPGPTTTSTSSITTLLSPSTFGFDPSGFLQRWNTVAGEFGLQRDAFDIVEASGAILVLNVPEASIEWAIAIPIDPVSGQATAVTFAAPLSDDQATLLANQSGVMIVISIVEGFDDVLEAGAVLDQLFAQFDPEFTILSVTTTTPAATYRLSLTDETRYYLEATP